MRIAHSLASLALVLLCITPVAGQQPAAPSAGSTIRGTVIDSLAGSPLTRATVQLVSSSTRPAVARTTETDSAGRFAFGEVAEGEYVVGFLHPVLDSLGLEPIARAVTVAGEREVAVELAVPAPARLRGAFCGGAGGGAIIGFVRAARGGAPVQGATVRGEWLEISLGTQGVGSRRAERVATTGAGGEFALCDVPSPGTVMLAASQGAGSTDPIELDVPAHGLLRRSLFLGEAVAAARTDTARAGDTVPAPSSIRRGPGRLSGTVVAGADGAPLAGARVRVLNGETAQANARGEWTLSDAPSGTRVIEVRATGYYPVQRAVDIADGAAPVTVRLSRLAAMLDTIRAVARRQPGRLSGFEERRRASGAGRFLTAADIERRRILEFSEIFNYVPGLTRMRDTTGDNTLVMRSAFGEQCVPAVFLDGNLMRNLAPSDLDTLVDPKEVAAVEVYLETQAPPQFQAFMSGCGSIVVWTR